MTTRCTPATTAAQAAATCVRILDAIETVVVGKRHQLQLVLSGLLAGGHVLIEDLPGLGKTLIARSLAQVTGLTVGRVQFTPDLMPADVTGSLLYNQQSHEFTFRQGPIFHNVIIADEINRAPPKTQASLLEAMQAEKARVTMELGSLATERVKPRKLPSLEISPRLATSPSLEISPKLATGAADGHTQALVTEPVDACTEELGLEDVDELDRTENVAADALRMGGKAPLPPLVAQREQPELPDEHPAVESEEQAKLQPGRLAPLPSTATAIGNAIHTDIDSPPMWRKAPTEALQPIGR